MSRSSPNPQRLPGIGHQTAGRPPECWPGMVATPSVAELLDVDREYRRKLSGLPHITPRRFNPGRTRWLPVLHTNRGARRYTALFSNTPRAHRFGRTRDWVLIFYDSPSDRGSATIVSGRAGRLRGRRLVRGRETESAKHYGVWRPPEGEILRFDNLSAVRPEFEPSPPEPSPPELASPPQLLKIRRAS